MLYILDTTAMKLVASTETFEQAEYLADLIVPNKNNPHIDSLGFDGLEVFNNKELATIYCNTGGREIKGRDLDDRDYLMGLLIHTGKQLLDERTTGSLYAALGRLPNKLSKLPAVEHRVAATPRTSGTSTGARQSGVKERVYELADAAWAEAGSPTDTSVILKLRKQWMNDWEALGIKRTSASSTLGQWQKERVNVG